MSPQDIVDNHCIGQFNVPYNYLKRAPGVFQAVTKNMIIVRCEQRYDMHSFHYIALSEHFEPQPDFCKETPWYEFEVFQQGPNKYIISWRRRQW